MFKKIMALVLVMALTAAVAIGGTVAYLTDRDSEANVFTVGDVAIDLTEDFEQGTALIPGVEIEKKPVITNTGKNDAWVWLEFAIPSSLDNAVQGTETGSNENTIHWNPKGATSEGYVTQERVEAAIAAGFFEGFDTTNLTAEYINTNKMHWNVFNSIDDGVNMKTTKINEVDYNVYVLMYNKPLTRGETTLPNIEKVFLDSHIDIDTNGDWYRIENGVATNQNPLWNSNTNGDPIIYVSAYAVQAEGFATARDAYNAYWTQWGDNGAEYVPGTVVTTSDNLVQALEAGEDVVMTEDIKIDPAGMSNAYGTTGINVKNGQTIDGGGHTLDIKGAGGTWDSGINTTGGKIKNITVTGSFRGIFINHNSTHSERVILENVIIDGTTYTISCDQGSNQGLTATNSTFNGWTSYAATLGDAKFINCSFGEGGGYAYCRPYAPTEFVGCDFEAGFEMDARAAVTFENCTIGGVALTAANLSTLVTSNIANATVK